MEKWHGRAHSESPPIPPCPRAPVPPCRYFNGIAFVSSSPIIAIIDDDPDVRGSLDSLLRSVGMTPRCYAGAEEMLASGGHEELACIVTDLHMPGMTGLELQAQLSARGWRTPFILVTAYPTDAARDQATRAGACGFLTKPVDPDRLLDAIEDAIR
ncbi:two-component system response regulator [Sphingopyxis terrae subsp. ummariensis]|nr:two-component system response regulator [Sphingopyxis terrae subsp. ummariensis]